jgi:hypothetical protein
VITDSKSSSLIGGTVVILGAPVKDLAAIVHVLIDLLDQGVQSIEFLLVSNLGDEFYAYGLAIEVPTEVHDEHFHQPLG